MVRWRCGSGKKLVGPCYASVNAFFSLPRMSLIGSDGVAVMKAGDCQFAGLPQQPGPPRYSGMLYRRGPPIPSVLCKASYAQGLLRQTTVSARLPNET